MSDCIRCNRKADFCSHHVYEDLRKERAKSKRQRAEIRRLRAVIKTVAWCYSCVSCSQDAVAALAPKRGKHAR